MIVSSADFLVRGIDGLVARDVNLDKFQRRLARWELVLEVLYSFLSLGDTPAAEDDVVSLGGSHEGLDGLVANARVGAGDEDDWGGCHFFLVGGDTLKTRWTEVYVVKWKKVETE